jgi:hypothetical protein
MPLRSPVVIFFTGILTISGLVARAADRAGPGPPPPPAASVYKLVIWYDRIRPFDSFQYRTYNVTRGQYTKAVDDWIALMERDFPRYTVTVRELTIAAGDSAKKIAAAVENEKLVLAKYILQKYAIGQERRRTGYQSGYRGVGTPLAAERKTNRTPFENPIPNHFPALGSAGTTPPSGYPFPNPWPYPRPRP